MSFIGLLDCNNFFVSCERLFRPDLKQYPVVVLSSNDGVVVSRSQEVKELGVPMGVPFFKVKDIIEQNKVAVFSSNFDLYRDLSNRVMDTLKNKAEDVYQYSVDEAFFRLPEQGALKRLAHIKATVERNVGLPVSLGAGKTMTIAKYASEREKRGTGACVLEGKQWTELSKEIPLNEIWGIGGATAKKMKEHGLITVDDLRNANEGQVQKLFGVHGLRLRSELSEIPAHEPEERAGLQQSIMSTRSFSKTTTDINILEEAITYHIERAAEELRMIGGKCLSLRVLLRTSRHGDYFLWGGSDEATFPTPVNDTRVLLKAALQLVKDIYVPDVPYKKAGVILGRIVPAETSQLELFESKSNEVLMKVIDGINSKLGRDTLTMGRMKGSGSRLASLRFSSPHYTTDWNEIKTIS